MATEIFAELWMSDRESTVVAAPLTESWDQFSPVEPDPKDLGLAVADGNWDKG